MRHLPRLILLAATAVILTACAQGTQTLRLSPTPAAVESLVGSGQSLGLSVEDARTDRDLGMLENPDGSIARLMPAQQITYTLQLAAAETLRGYDFEPSLWDEARTPRLEIRIETLDHQVTAGVPYELATEVALTATGYADGQRYTTRSGTTLTRQRPLPPTADANADAINTALSRALGQLLDDELARFLATGR
ncbi:YajG family lipoprotein [Spiribacter pallidus]|jgi:uncharacterized lipoprotein|uniref:YajG family lipoprotein n=1 Tax=Spiribacter pallidus TaxID=1987936 RepID=UPI0034A014F5